MSEAGRKRQALLDAAIAARARAYAPYSNFRVGAALEIAGGTVVTGVNVENCSYGLTVCAERHAIAAAVNAGLTPGNVVALAIAADAETPTSPCGACRQVLAEFLPPTAPIVLVNVRDGSITETNLAELLPRAFTRSSLSKA